MNKGLFQHCVNKGSFQYCMLSMYRTLCSMERTCRSWSLRYKQTLLLVKGQQNCTRSRSKTSHLMAATSACSLPAGPAFFFFFARGFLGAGLVSTSFAQAVKLLYLHNRRHLADSQQHPPKRVRQSFAACHKSPVLCKHVQDMMWTFIPFMLTMSSFTLIITCTLCPLLI